jgi:hypothetical protein
MKTKTKKKTAEIKLPVGHSEKEIQERLKRLINEMSELGTVIIYYGGFNPIRRLMSHYLGVTANHLVMLRKAIQVDRLTETTHIGSESVAKKIGSPLSGMGCDIIKPTAIVPTLKQQAMIRKRNEESLKSTMRMIRQGGSEQTLPKGIAGVNAGAVKIINEATKKHGRKLNPRG